MSLIRIRRERQELLTGPDRPGRLWKLVLGTAVVAVLLWYLGQVS